VERGKSPPIPTPLPSLSPCRRIHQARRVGRDSGVEDEGHRHDQAEHSKLSGETESRDDGQPQPSSPVRRIGVFDIITTVRSKSTAPRPGLSAIFDSFEIEKTCEGSPGYPPCDRLSNDRVRDQPVAAWFLPGM